MSRFEDRWKHKAPGEVVLLDNRDSFVFNLAHRLYEVSGCHPVVVRSDEVSASELMEWAPRALVISPGPGHPEEAGCSVEVVRRFAGKVPVLGVCLGHQAIVEAYGGDVVSSGRPMHGRASWIEHDGRGLFEGQSAEGVKVARYHALVAREPLPEVLEASAWLDEPGEPRMVMGVRHVTHEVYGVQFHPESVLTGEGRGMLARFMSRVKLIDAL